MQVVLVVPDEVRESRLLEETDEFRESCYLSKAVHLALEVNECLRGQELSPRDLVAGCLLGGMLGLALEFDCRLRVGISLEFHLFVGRSDGGVDNLLHTRKTFES